MIRIGILGDIGSGKSHAARQFGYPVFNADLEVGKLYKKNRKCYRRLQKALPHYIFSFPIKKAELSKALMASSHNLLKIIKIVHPEVRLSMHRFLKRNKNKKAVILDIPLLLENKINRKKDILIFIHAKKKEIDKRLKKRKNFHSKIFKKLKKLQLPVEIKKKKADYIIKNNFNNYLLKINVKKVLRNIL